MPASIPLYFPGLVTVRVPNPATAVCTCDADEDGRRDLIVGFANGTIGLMTNSGGGQFRLLGSLVVDGTVVAAAVIRQEPGQPVEAIAVTANPDRAVIVRTADATPPLTVVDRLDLDEDPGAVAVGRDAATGDPRCMVALPGSDRWLLLGEGAPDDWRLLQEVPGGDRPIGIVLMDLDGDLVDELITADNGYLSHGLSVFEADGAGLYELAQQVPTPGAPAALAAFAVPAGGVPDLYVSYSDSAFVSVLRPQGGQLLPLERLALSLPADGIHLGRFPSGEAGLWSWNVGRGLLDYHRNSGAGWAYVESYSTVGPAISTELVDLNLDRFLDLLIVNGATGNLGILYGNNLRGFRGFYAGPLSTQPSEAEVLDEDADGRLDCLVACFGGHTLDVLHGDGHGRWLPEALHVDLGERPLSLTTLLADADTIPEIAVTLPEVNRVLLLRRQAGGGYLPGAAITTGSFPLRVVSGDLDQDGAADLVVANLYSRNLTVAFGAGDGTFPDVRELTSYGAVEDVALVRLNADALPDLVIADGLSQVYTLRSAGDRTFLSPMFYNISEQPSHLATGDLDGDSDDDLVVARSASGVLSVLDNVGNGFLVTRLATVQLGGYPSGLAVADVDMDGRRDIVSTLRDTREAVVLLNLASWTLSPPLRFAATLQPRDLFVRDANRDGVPDFVLLDQELELVVTMLNIEPNPVPVAPPALAVSCAEGIVEVRWRAPAEAAWRLEGATADGWALLADPSGAGWGELSREPDAGGGSEAGADAWRLALPEAAREKAGLAREPDEGWRFRLVGASAASVTAAGGQPCAAAGDVGTPLALAAPRPNPANPRVRADLILPRPAWTRAVVCDLAGREVALLHEGWLAAGEHALSWDGTANGRPVGAGIYFLTVTAEGRRLTRKVALVK